MKMVKTLVGAAVVSASVLMSGCVVHIGDQVAGQGRDASATVGNISVNAGDTAGELRTVAGNISIGERAITDEIKAVNGNIEVGDNAKAKQLETVNGNIEAGKSVVVEGSVRVVNGDIRFKADGQIHGQVTLVRGKISLAQNTHVYGDIVFEKRSDDVDDDKDKMPKLSLAQGVKVDGQILLYQPVTLDFANPAMQEKVERHFE